MCTKRINLSLNIDNDKDKIIYGFLESKYNAQAFIKETLFQMAVNREGNVGFQEVDTSVLNTVPGTDKKDVCEVDSILGVENIEL